MEHIDDVTCRDGNLEKLDLAMAATGGRHRRKLFRLVNSPFVTARDHNPCFAGESATLIRSPLWHSVETHG